MRIHTLPMLGTLAVLLALPSVAHAQHAGHSRGGDSFSRPVHVVHAPTRGSIRADVVQRQLEREWAELAATSNGYGDPTADRYLADADAALRAASRAERQGRWGAMWGSLDAADASLRAADDRLRSLYAEVASLRRAANRRTSQARGDLVAHGRHAHELARLLIDAERAQIQGEGAWIRGDYLSARLAFAEALACVDEAYVVASRYERRPVHPPHHRPAHYERDRGYLPVSGHPPGRRGGYL